VRRDVVLELSADPAGVAEAARRVVALLERVPPDVVFACELAVVEACANIAHHGFGDRCGRMRVVARASPVRLAVAICDTAPEFAGTERPMPSSDAESGRGLALVAACMDRVRWERTDGENRLLMARRLDVC
jgi:anti-sigma regulatory factor (Ser/Thr protein kinase)